MEESTNASGCGWLISCVHLLYQIPLPLTASLLTPYKFQRVCMNIKISS